ncbi:CshA/CshB family fibrillar adhesin-related protein [Agrococcus sp. 1P02AA]|uniref:CshA/CshB family fibrillar adhesin-related protein n=1 Tax=Agrococcus sp. 1P02AA TaxID=3132259 RepID=UPI0039A785F9
MRASRTRRSIGVIAAATAAILLGAVLAPLSPLTPASEAEAAQATGGSGRYLQSIEWIEWGTHNQAVGNGTRTTTVTVAGQPLTVSCTISSLNGSLAAYRPGSWSGDALDELYNIGGTGGSNRLISGLSGPDNSLVTFNLACSAAYQGANVPLAGLVFADAEQSGNQEHVGATAPAGATWRMIDGHRTAGCTADSYAYRPSTSPQRLELYGPTAPCASGPATVAFVDGATSLTSVTVRGGGKSAIALGVMLALDFGDAPASYGDAGAILQPRYDRGEVPLTTGAWSTTNRGAAVFGSIPFATPSTSTTTPVGTIGATVDGEGAPNPGPGTADDSSGIDDEDALFTFTSPTTGLQVTSGALQVATAAGQQYQVRVSCTGTGAVRGWLDWNRNGSFTGAADAADASQQTVCASGSATLAWTVPATVVAAPAATPTYLRLRIGATGTTLAPTGVAAVGEVEDHPVVVALPQLAVTKGSSVPAGTGGVPGQPVEYTVTLRNSGQTLLSSPRLTDDLSGVLDRATFVEGSLRAVVSAGDQGAVARTGTTITWQRTAGLPVGATVTLTYRVQLSEASRGLTVRNTATATATPVGSTAVLSQTAAVANDVAVRLDVRKAWVVDGVSYPEGTQPAGLTASATLTGPGAAGASAQPWGVPRDGYLPGATVTVAETTSIAPSVSCSLVSSTATAGGVTRPVPATVTLSGATTIVTVTNTVTCESTLTLVTSVDHGSASAGQWTLTATGPSASVSGPTGVTGRVSPTADYTLAHAGPATYVPSGPWSCTTDAGVPVALTGAVVRVPTGADVTCEIGQTTAELTLLKQVIDERGQLVPAAFELIASPAQLAGLTPTVVQGAEQALPANTFEVRPGHAYALTEGGAAPHLALSLERYLGDPDAPIDHADAALWQAADPGAVSVGPAEHEVFRFVNQAVPAFALPRTGGIGADQVALAGGGVLALGMLLVLALAVRQRRAH